MHFLHARIGRAIIINPLDAPPDHVHFGSIVTVRDPNDHEMRIQIVGEDETEVALVLDALADQLLVAGLEHVQGDPLCRQEDGSERK